jgi:hypothetical protein
MNALVSVSKRSERATVLRCYEISSGDQTFPILLAI